MSSVNKKIYQSGKVIHQSPSAQTEDFNFEIIGQLNVSGDFVVGGDVVSSNVSEENLQINDKSILLNRGEPGPGVGGSPSGTTGDPYSGLLIDRGVYEQDGVDTEGNPIYVESTTPYTPASFIWNEDLHSWHFNGNINSFDLNSNPFVDTFQDPRLMGVGDPQGDHRSTDLQDNEFASTASNVRWVAGITNPIEDNIDDIENYINISQPKTDDHIPYWVSDTSVYGGYIEYAELEIFKDKSPQLGSDLDVNGFDIFNTNSLLSLDSGAAILSALTQTEILSDGTVIISSPTTNIGTSTDQVNISGASTNISPTGNVSINGYIMPSSDGLDGQAMVTDGLGNVSFNNVVNEASKLETPRTISVSGAVTGSASFDGTSNITISTTATSDPTLTLSGDVSGSATFTNLGDATLTATIANDSHSHTTSTITGFTEDVQDVVGGMVTSNTESGIAVTYNDTSGKLNFNVNDPTLTLSGDVSGSATFTNLGDATLTVTVANDSHSHTTSTITGFTEDVQDVVGGMVTSNTESGIAVTYNDTSGKLNFNVNDPTISLTGDVSGSATMTNLGNTSIAATVANDSHSHTYSTLPMSSTDASNWTTAYNVRISGVSGSGNGTLTLTRPDTTNLTTDLSHTHTSSEVSGVVKTTGAQSISGTKTFTTGIVSASYDTTSSLKYKNVLDWDIGPVIDKLNSIDVIRYSNKKDKSNKEHIGVSAESLSKVFPEFVTFKNNEPDSVNYGQLTSVILRAFQEQEENRLKNKIKRKFNSIISRFKNNKE